MLQIAKDAGGLQQLKNFSIKRPLALVREVMDREARHHRVERSELGKPPIEIVFEHGYPMVARKTATGAFEHGWRKIDRHARGPRTAIENQRQQPAVARAQVNNPARARWNAIEKSALAFATMRNLAGDREIAGGVALFGPFVHIGHATLLVVLNQGKHIDAGQLGPPVEKGEFDCE